MADQQYLLDLVTSISTNIPNKYINIIFLYAGPATTELAICKELRRRRFRINKIFLHDVLYEDDNYSRGVKRLFNDSGFDKLVFSRTCENIEQIDVEEDEPSTDDDDDEKFDKPYSVCIACRPQLGNFNGNIINDNQDINNFISTFFSSEKNNFIFTLVDNNFVLYTKQNYNACINNPANIHHQNIHKFCFFNALYGDLAGGKGNKRKNKTGKRKRKNKTDKRKNKTCKRKHKSCKRKLNIYNHY